MKKICYHYHRERSHTCIAEVEIGNYPPDEISYVTVTSPLNPELMHESFFVNKKISNLMPVSDTKCQCAVCGIKVSKSRQKQMEVLLGFISKRIDSACLSHEYTTDIDGLNISEKQKVAYRSYLARWNYLLGRYHWDWRTDQCLLLLFAGIEPVRYRLNADGTKEIIEVLRDPLQWELL